MAKKKNSVQAANQIPSLNINTNDTKPKTESKSTQAERPCEDCPLKLEWQQELIMLIERKGCPELKNDLPYLTNNDRYKVFLSLRDTGE